MYVLPGLGQFITGGSHSPGGTCDPGTGFDPSTGGCTAAAFQVAQAKAPAAPPLAAAPTLKPGDPGYCQQESFVPLAGCVGGVYLGTGSNTLFYVGLGIAALVALFAFSGGGR